MKARATLRGRNVVLEAGGQISGRVTGHDGSGLSGVAAWVYRRTLSDGTWVPVAYDGTDTGGRYFVSNLRSGT